MKNICIAAISAVFLVNQAEARSESMYPDLDDGVQFSNYADNYQQEQVIYDYVDHGSAYQDDYDSNRYYMEEKRANEYDYNSRDYVVVEEGTEGSRTEQGGWHYEPRDYDYGSSYGSRGSYYGDDYGRGSNYGDRRGRGGGDVHHHHHHSDGYRGSYYGDDYGRGSDYGDRRRQGERHNQHQNHYSNYGSYNQNHYGSNSDLSTGSIVFIGFVIVVLCVGGCIYLQIVEAQRKERVQGNSKQVTVSQAAPDRPMNANQGQPIFFTGPCYVDGPVSDPKFGIMTAGHPVLYRDVEVFQWEETRETIKERRGDQVRNSEKFSYKATWGKIYCDSRSYRDQKYNQNQRPNINSECFRGSNVRVGTFYSVDLNSLENAFGTTALTISNLGPVSAEPDNSGIWSTDQRNNCMVRQRNPGKDTVGDVRVKYRVLNQFSDASVDRTILATVCGVPQGNRITNWGNLKTSVMAGRVDKDRFLDAQTK